MHPQPKDIELNTLSFDCEGTVEFDGSVRWQAGATGVAAADSVFLRITRRGTDEHFEVSGKLDPEGRMESRFYCQMETKELTYSGSDDIHDVYLVFRNQDGESLMRLIWPTSKTAWVVYPTTYGNLSMKKPAGESTAP